MKVIKPDSPDQQGVGVTVFLAGSIEMDVADKWQEDIETTFKGKENLTLFNPRRDKWNKDWKQTLDDPNFVAQVDWELDRLEEADIVFFYFDPKTISPISLLEWGMYTRCSPEKIVCCCPDGYFRKGNLQVTGRKYGVEIHDIMSFAKIALFEKITEIQFAKYGHTGEN